MEAVRQAEEGTYFFLIVIKLRPAETVFGLCHLQVLETAHKRETPKLNLDVHSVPIEEADIVQTSVISRKEPNEQPIETSQLGVPPRGDPVLLNRHRPVRTAPD